jgi:hypothetical protein
MTKKYTPGPWMSGLNSRLEIVVADEKSLVPICVINQDKLEFEYNKKLIALAPDMLDAVIMAKELIGYFRTKEEGPTHDTWNKLDILIKKATK